MRSYVALGGHVGGPIDISMNDDPGSARSVRMLERVIVRKEYPADIGTIRELVTAAFPTPNEAGLVDALRAAGRLSISLVAVEGDGVVGHVGFSPITVEGATRGLGLAPVSVRADRRRQGIAERLVRDGLGLCRNAAVGLVVVLGDPRYYARFGFEAARRLELRDEYQAGDAFQALELIPGSIPPGGGLVRYAPEFATLGTAER